MDKLLAASFASLVINSVCRTEQFLPTFFLYFLRILNCRYVTLSESFQFPLFDGALFERLNLSSAFTLPSSDN